MSEHKKTHLLLAGDMRLFRLLYYVPREGDGGVAAPCSVRPLLALAAWKRAARTGGGSTHPLHPQATEWPLLPNPASRKEQPALQKSNKPIGKILILKSDIWSVFFQEVWTG